MADDLLPADEAPPPPDVDEYGVDRGQIRDMLELTPLERLRRIQAFVNAALALRERNVTRARPVR